MSWINNPTTYAASSTRFTAIKRFNNPMPIPDPASPVMPAVHASVARIQQFLLPTGLKSTSPSTLACNAIHFSHSWKAQPQFNLLGLFVELKTNKFTFLSQLHLSFSNLKFSIDGLLLDETICNFVKTLLNNHYGIPNQKPQIQINLRKCTYFTTPHLLYIFYSQHTCSCWEENHHQFCTTITSANLSFYKFCSYLILPRLFGF